VDPVPGPLLPIKNLVAPGIESGTSGFVARNSGHETTEELILQRNTNLEMVGIIYE
jgi:hypothetical protein